MWLGEDGGDDVRRGRQTGEGALRRGDDGDGSGAASGRRHWVAGTSVLPPLDPNGIDQSWGGGVVVGEQEVEDGP